MIIDPHVHLGDYPSLADMGEVVKSTEEIIGWRTRFPERYHHALFEEEATDNSELLIRDLDEHGISYALVQAYPGGVSNDLVAQAVKAHPERLRGLMRIGHDQEARGYLDDPTPIARSAPEEVARCVEDLGMIGIGEICIRALTRASHPEDIADDLEPLMSAAETYGLPVQFPTAWTQFPGGLVYGDATWADEVAGRHPQTKIVLTKMGRSIRTYFDAVMTVALRNSNVYLDTVGTSSAHLREAIDALGSTRVMFGSDWALSWLWLSEPASLYPMRMSVLEGARLSESESEDVLWRTAQAVFEWPESA